MAYRLRTDKTWAETEAAIRNELRLWGADTYQFARPNAVGRTNRSWRESPDEALVVLTATWKGGRALRLQYNKQDRAVDNARVLFLAVQALRLNEVRGIDDVLREAYLQLEAPAPVRDPYEVLGARPDADMEDIEALYRSKAKRLHPDAGGSTEAMAELNQALERIKAERAALV